MGLIGLYTDYERRLILMFLVILFGSVGFWQLLELLLSPITPSGNAIVKSLSFTNFARTMHVHLTNCVKRAVSLVIGKYSITNAYQVGSCKAISWGYQAKAKPQWFSCFDCLSETRQPNQSSRNLQCFRNINAREQRQYRIHCQRCSLKREKLDS
jgi:hypothetical protein